jgi:uncharacterized protein (DUF2062 family)
MLSLAKIRTYLTQILHLDESPHRTALAFAVGIFIAFSPTYGLHALSGVFCAWAFRLNAVALMAGVLINNPWTTLPILGATLWTGLQLMEIPQGGSLSWEEIRIETLYAQIAPYALPFFVGGFVLSLLAAALSYPIAYVVIARHRRLRRGFTEEDC